jgi:hypothetical protein
MNCFKSLFVSVLLLSTTMFSAHAQQSPWRGILGANFEFGGDRVAEIYFTNGNTQSVRAGQGGHFYAGAEYRFPKAQKLALRGTVGIKYVTTAADNAHIRLTRIPFQFTANLYPAQKLRIAAGLSSHTGIRFNADGIMQNLSFQSANGPVFEIAYAGIGLTYTAMNYKNKEYGDVYSANAFGFSFSTTFGNKKRIPAVNEASKP